MVVPTFGPNNQYMGTKETAVLAKILGRDLVQPVYTAHLTRGASGARSFSSTFNASKLDHFLENFPSSSFSTPIKDNKRIRSIEFDKFKEDCNNQVDTLFWLRNPGSYWREELANYEQINGLKRAKLEVHPIRHIGETESGTFADKIFLTSTDMVTAYFHGYEDSKCLGIAFPFRTVGGSLINAIEMTHLGFHHPDSIIEEATRAITQINVDPSNLLTVHWRWGEATCRVESEKLHPAYDFCWGTTEYYWARSKDVAAALSSHISQCKDSIKTIYFATDNKDDKVFGMFRSELFNRGISVLRATDVPLLDSISDNYHLSLVEQEIALQSHSFLGSGGTTWSEEMINYRRLNFKQQFGTCMIWTLADLMRNQSRPIITHNYWDHVLNYKGK